MHQEPDVDRTAFAKQLTALKAHRDALPTDMRAVFAADLQGML